MTIYEYVEVREEKIQEYDENFDKKKNLVFYFSIVDKRDSKLIKRLKGGTSRAKAHAHAMYHEEEIIRAIKSWKTL